MAEMSKSQKATYDKMVAAGDKQHAEDFRTAIEGADVHSGDAQPASAPAKPARTKEQAHQDLMNAISAHLGHPADIAALLDELFPKEAPADSEK